MGTTDSTASLPDLINEPQERPQTHERVQDSQIAPKRDIKQKPWKPINDQNSLLTGQLKPSANFSWIIQSDIWSGRDYAHPIVNGKIGLSGLSVNDFVGTKDPADAYVAIDIANGSPANVHKSAPISTEKTQESQTPRQSSAKRKKGPDEEQQPSRENKRLRPRPIVR